LAETVSERENELIIVIGRKGSGKSTRARKIALTRPRRIYIDSMHEHTDGVIVRSYAALVDYIRPRVHGSYAVILRTLNEDDVFATLALATATNDPERPPLPGVTYIIDEADKYMAPGSLPHPVNMIVNYGRHFQVSAIFIARRAKRLHIDVRSNADRYIIGQTFEPGDVDGIEEFIGVELAERVRAIPTRTEGAAPVFVEWP
jgi:energy-coupling factor transporter ATP-binding protein EcfA2